MDAEVRAPDDALAQPEVQQRFRQRGAQGDDALGPRGQGDRAADLVGVGKEFGVHLAGVKIKNPGHAPGF